MNPSTPTFPRPFNRVRLLCAGLLLVGTGPLARAEGADAGFDPLKALEGCNVVWNEPGQSSADSMPLGNGDIGLNVWTEPNGDLVFYIGKSDAWTENPNDALGLAKLGRVRVSMNPAAAPAAAPAFVQTLKLHEGEIEVREGDEKTGTTFRVWVDANHPVIRVEVKSARPASARVALEVWRTAPVKRVSPDTVLPDQKDRIVWYHHDGKGAEAHVLDWTFGGLIQGDGLRSIDAQTLQSAAPTLSQSICIYPLTTPASPPEAWVAKVSQQAASLAALDLEKTRREHRQWWDEFWHRSWIFLGGGARAQETTEGYVLQRFVTACAGRGAYAIKFNGSLFVVDHPAESQGGKPPVVGPVSADFRAWGGQYWFQNTRPMYWPRLMAGDFDIMLPLFKMYREMLPANAALVQKYYHHDGAYCAETAPFWGGFSDLTNNGPGSYTANYFTDLLELSMMGLDYHEYTGDRAFLHDTVVPIAGAILTFFDQHFPHDASGKLVLDPDNSIEMYWKVHNPAPDIAGLHAVLARLLALPEGLLDEATRKDWQRIQAALPPLPTGVVNGRKVLLPYEGEQTRPRHNSENPELYSIYPFRLYGLGRPELEMARDTFAVRLNKTTGCWVQDPIQAAMLGLTDLAQQDVTFNLTRKDPALKFAAFWARGHDYMPDEDNGGNGENGLQEMLMQINGRQILLLPAWPKNWDAAFKLHAPFQTVIEGQVVGGRLTGLSVTPPERKKDIVLPDGAALMQAETAPPAPAAPPAAKIDPATLLPPEQGPFQPTMESFKTYECPDWFRDAKFGIWAHWGPDSQPGFSNNFAHDMWTQGNGDYNWFVAHFGHPSKFGYKDVIESWKAEKWDPNALMARYKAAGAKYFFALATHHDNFDSFDSPHHEWNALRHGPHEDIVGMWRAAALKAGLRFGVSSHADARGWNYMYGAQTSDKTGPLVDVPYEGTNPKYEALYNQPTGPKDSPPDNWKREWLQRHVDLVDKYKPDLLYFDSGIPHGPYGMALIAHYLNDNAAAHGGKVDAVVNVKAGTFVSDHERNIATTLQVKPWQGETSLGGWFYMEHNPHGDQHSLVKDAPTVIDSLIDIVSKNGNYLLNLPQRGDGTLYPECEQVLDELIKWMPINGEAIFATRPWTTYGEGPSVIPPQGMNELMHPLTWQDFRFTTKPGVLYAFCLGIPQGPVKITSLAGQSDKIADISLLGSTEKIAWQAAADGVSIQPSKAWPCAHAICYKIAWK